jgi:hypothetical protein
MRLAAALGLSVLVAGSVSGQQRGVFARGAHVPRTYGSRSGFGNILFPGTGSPPPLTGPTFAQRLGANVAGQPILGPAPGTPHRLGYRPGGAAYYAVPVYVGGGYWGGGYGPAPEVRVMLESLPAPQPPVIINQYYTVGDPKPVVREYAEGSLPEPGDSTIHAYRAPPPAQPAPEAGQPTIYLIAFTDHNIQAAVGYWLEGDTLHYISLQGTHNRASIELVDRAFSERLNRERNVEFDLGPGAVR